MRNSSRNGNPNGKRNGQLSDIQLCYAAALIYGLRLVDEKAFERGELFIPVDICREKCRPEIDSKYLRDFVQVVGNRIAKASHL
jgi:hypothetical protein